MAVGQGGATMHTLPEESIGLTSRSPYLDDASMHSDSHISASDTLCEDAADIADTNHTRPKWRNVLNRKQGRRKPSKPSSSFTERLTLGRRKRSRNCLNFCIGVLVMLCVLLPARNDLNADDSTSGVIQIYSLVRALIVFFVPGGVHDIVKSWGHPGQPGAGLASWPTDFSRDILPIPCHSHNDYWRTVPLFSAIEAGCIGVEADIWLFEEELFVGHSIQSLTRNRTLNSLYIKPLLDILSNQNPKDTLFREEGSRLHGVFDTNPEQSLILLIDFKTAGDALWPYVQSALEPLRAQGYLTRSNDTEIIPGPITVVGTGNTPFNLVDSDTSNSNHDVFFDAPLDDMYEAARDVSSEERPTPTVSAENNEPNFTQDGISRGTSASVASNLKQSNGSGQGKSGIPSKSPEVFSTTNSYYASVSFGAKIGVLWNGEFSEIQLEQIRGQIRGAHRRGLKARYWDLPFWPISLRNHVWDVLMKEGIDLLNVDDLKGATKRNWDEHQGWWKRMKGPAYDVHGGISGAIETPMAAFD